MTTETGTAVEVGHRGSSVADTPSVESMMSMAVQQGTEGVEALEKLVALRERMEDRSARMAFLNALAAFQDAMIEVPKKGHADIVTSTGTNYSYNFARLEDITRAIRQPLRDHGLSYSWDTEPSDKSGDLIVVCVLRHTDGHEERSRFPVPTATAAKMSDAQKNGAALTYGRRQSLIAVLGLTAADEDTDGADKSQAIDAGQVADLEALIDEVAADRPKFLKYMRVEALSDIRTADYPRALKALERKRAAS